MPLKKGKSRKVQSANIKEIMDAYKESGKIGTSRPKSKFEALKQAIAISYAQKAKSKSKKRKK